MILTKYRRSGRVRAAQTRLVMRKIGLLSAAVIPAAIVLLWGVCSSAGDSLAFESKRRTDTRTAGCFSVVVGKDASAEGCVILAHNEDDYIPQIVNHHKVPRKQYPPGAVVRLVNGGTVEQVPETWSYIWSEMPGLLFSDSYLNEWGVSICSDACPSREDQPELTDGGITYMLRRLVAERARSAREGIHIAGDLIDRFGYDASGRTYMICDPDEGWLFAAVNGKHWMAKRVPDDEVALIANTYTIHEIDLTDTLNYLGSSDIVTYARTRGWHGSDTDHDFDFAAAYADPDVAADPRNTGRQWDGIRHLASDPPAYNEPLPFSVIPKDKIDIEDIMTVMRSHYEGTELYDTDSSSCPHGNRITPICRHDTQTSFIAQLRGNMPRDIGLLYWVCHSSPCVSCYIPFYFGLESFPGYFVGPGTAPTEEEYFRRVTGPFQTDTTSAFWTFTHLRHTAENDYPRLAAAVRKAFDAVEEEAISNQGAIEAQAIDMYAQDKARACSYLTEYSRKVYHSAMEVLQYIGEKK